MSAENSREKGSSASQKFFKIGGAITAATMLAEGCAPLVSPKQNESPQNEVKGEFIDRITIPQGGFLNKDYLQGKIEEAIGYPVDVVSADPGSNIEGFTSGNVSISPFAVETDSELLLGACTGEKGSTSCSLYDVSKVEQSTTFNNEGEEQQLQSLKYPEIVMNGRGETKEGNFGDNLEITFKSVNNGIIPGEIEEISVTQDGIEKSVDLSNNATPTPEIYSRFISFMDRFVGGSTDKVNVKMKVGQTIQGASQQVGERNQKGRIVERQRNYQESSKNIISVSGKKEMNESTDEIFKLAKRLNLEVTSEGSEFDLKSPTTGNSIFRVRNVSEIESEFTPQAYWQMERVVDGKIKSFGLTSTLGDFNLNNNEIITRGVVDSVGSAEFIYGDNGWDIKSGVLVFSEFNNNINPELEDKILKITDMIKDDKATFFDLKGWKKMGTDPWRQTFDYNDFRNSDKGEIVSVFTKNYGQGEIPIFTDQRGRLIIPQEGIIDHACFILVPENEDLENYLSQSDKDNGGNGIIKVNEPTVEIIDSIKTPFNTQVMRTLSIYKSQYKETTIFDMDEIDLMFKKLPIPMYKVSWLVNYESGEDASSSNLFMNVIGNKDVNMGSSNKGVFFGFANETDEVIKARYAFYLSGITSNLRLSLTEAPLGYTLRLKSMEKEALLAHSNKVFDDALIGDSRKWFKPLSGKIVKYLVDENRVEMLAIILWPFRSGMVFRLEKTRDDEDSGYSPGQRLLRINEGRLATFPEAIGTVLHESEHADQSHIDGFHLAKTADTEVPAVIYTLIIKQSITGNFNYLGEEGIRAYIR